MKVHSLYTKPQSSSGHLANQESSQAIVWMGTVTQQEGVKQRSVQFQARSVAAPHTHAHTHKNRWLNGLLKALSIHLWIILIISKKAVILIFWGLAESVCVFD